MICDSLSFSKYPSRELIQGTFTTVLKFMTCKDCKLLTCFNWLLSLFKCYIIWNCKWINLAVFNSKNKVCLGALNFAVNETSLFRNDSMSNYACFYSMERIMEFSDAATWKFRLFSFDFYWGKKKKRVVCSYYALRYDEHCDAGVGHRGNSSPVILPDVVVIKHVYPRVALGSSQTNLRLNGMTGKKRLARLFCCLLYAILW